MDQENFWPYSQKSHHGHSFGGIASVSCKPTNSKPFYPHSTTLMQIRPELAEKLRKVLGQNFLEILCSHLPQWPHPLRDLLDANKVFLRSTFTQQMPGIAMSHNSSSLLAFSNAVQQIWHSQISPRHNSLSVWQLFPTSVSSSLSCVPINSIATWHF